MRKGDGISGARYQMSIVDVRRQKFAGRIGPIDTKRGKTQPGALRGAADARAARTRQKVCLFGQNGRFWIGKDGGIVSFKGHSDEEVEGEQAEAKDDEERAP